jgi:bacterioferritin-associated ferredoxin
VIVCLCRAASHEDIADAVAEGAGSVDDVGARCGAGTGCGSCHEYIRGVLSAAGISCDDGQSDRPVDCSERPISVSLRSK